MKIKEGNPVNIEPKKHLDLKWFPIDSLPQNITITTKRALEDFEKWRKMNDIPEELNNEKTCQS